MMMVFFFFRFDELVNRARIQDKISKDLVLERAKGLVEMLIRRRNYLKTRQKVRNSQVINNNNNNNNNSINMVGNWLSPNRLGLDMFPGRGEGRGEGRERSNPFLMVRSPSPKISRNSEKNSRQSSPKGGLSGGGNIQKKILQCEKRARSCLFTCMFEILS
jgi:hypothetical protein